MPYEIWNLPMRFKKLNFLLLFLFPLMSGFSKVPFSKGKSYNLKKIREGDWILKIRDQENGKIFSSILTLKNQKNCAGDIYSLKRNGESIEMRSFWESDYRISFSQNHDNLGYLHGFLEKVNNTFLKGIVQTDFGKEFQAELSYDRANPGTLVVDELLVSFFLFPLWEEGEELFPDSTRLIKADLIRDLNSSKFYICYSPLPRKVPDDHFFFSKYYLYSGDLEVRKKLMAIPLVDRKGIFKTVFPFEGFLKANLNKSAFWIFDNNNQTGIFFLKEKNLL